MQEKIFNLGLPKTGLSSFKFLLNSRDIECRGRIYDLAQMYHRREFAAMKKAYEDWGDAFCDIPTPFMYKALWNQYGADAKYVLTMRKDPDLWYQSMVRHNTYAHIFRHKHKRWFRYHYPHGFGDEHRAFYTKHNQDVRAFFEAHAPENFVAINIDTDNVIEKLRPLLGFPPELTEFPRRNVSGTRKEKIFDRLKRNYNKVVQPLYGKIAPRLVGRKPIEPIYPERFE